MSLDQRYELAEGLTFQELGPTDDTVILDVASGQLYTCNATTADLLKSLVASRTLGETIDALLETYEVDRPVLEADISRIVESLLGERIIVRVGAI